MGGFMSGVYLLGESKQFESVMLWWQRPHRLNLAAALPVLLGDTRADDWVGVADLVRDPGNDSDPNAVLVHLLGKPVGFVPADEAKRLAGWIDARNGEGLRVQAWCLVEFGMDSMAVRLSLY